MFSLIDLHPYGLFVNSSPDILWAGGTPRPPPSPYPFSYFLIEVSPGTFAAASITVMALLEAIPGLALE